MKKTTDKVIMSFDQGTTSSRTIIFDHEGNILSQAQKEFPQYYPQPGWVEHDPEEIWNSQYETARDALSLSGLSATEVVAIGITNQRETIVVWDKQTGKAVTRAVVWQCRRSTGICEELVANGLETEFRNRTGLRLDPYFSGTKLSWLFRNNSALRDRAEKGEILVGTIDSWLLWKLTGQHRTDITNASRTLLFNITDERWDPVLCSILGIPIHILPEVKQSSDDYGTTLSGLFDCSIPITGVAGDQQAALFGHGCFNPGTAKNTYGTGCFTLMNTGNHPVWSSNNLLTTVAWKIRGKTTYALEGSVFIAGAVIQWLRDELHMIQTSAESEQLALSVPDSAGVFLVPAFVGLGAPYWDPDVRGSLFGLTRGIGSAHIVRAALESIAYQSEDLLAAMCADSGTCLESLKADGGATANAFLMQFQANISAIPVSLPEVVEITALGAAYLAGLHCGYWDNLDEISRKWKEKKRFEPSMDKEERVYRMKAWHKAVCSAKEFKV